MINTNNHSYVCISLNFYMMFSLLHYIYFIYFVEILSLFVTGSVKTTHVCIVYIALRKQRMAQPIFDVFVLDLIIINYVLICVKATFLKNKSKFVCEYGGFSQILSHFVKKT